MHPLKNSDYSFIVIYICKSSYTSLCGERSAIFPNRISGAVHLTGMQNCKKIITNEIKKPLDVNVKKSDIMSNYNFHGPQQAFLTTKEVKRNVLK